FARQIRLRLLWRIRLVLPHVLRLRVVVHIVVTVVVALRCATALLRLLILLIVGVLLAELLLRGSDQTEIMLGVLIVIFGRDRIAGALRVTGKLDVLFRDMMPFRGFSHRDRSTRRLGLADSDFCG